MITHSPRPARLFLIRRTDKVPKFQNHKLDRITRSMVRTRATGRSIVRDLAIVLPDELWILILSKLGPLDIARAVCTSHAISAISQDIWQAACETRWPAWSGSSAAGVLCWKRQYEIFELRKREYGTQADIEAIQTTQSIVEPHHRLVLCEWLCEVRFDCCSK